VDRLNQPTKVKKETAKTLRLFEVYNPESLNKAIKNQLMMSASPSKAKNLSEFMESKKYRDAYTRGRQGKNLVQDDETLQRLGKKKLAPVHLVKYYEKLEAIKKSKA
jgi:hypothetical protein